MTNIHKAIEALSEISPSELDEADVETLLQLQFWCLRTMAPISVKSLGRVLKQLERQDIQVGEGSPRLGAPRLPEGTTFLQDICVGDWCAMVHPESGHTMGDAVQRIETEDIHEQAGRIKWRRASGETGYWAGIMPVLPVEAPKVQGERDG